MRNLLSLLILCLGFNGVAQTNKDIFKHKQFRNIGPFRGGRSAAVVGDIKNKQTFFMGATGGGVWKTNDGGSNWKNISDGFFGSSIGAIAIAVNDNSIMYVGEGENTMRGNVSEGISGMWKTEDGGRTWKNMGLKNARHVVRIIVHPKDANTVWVAVSGHLFGASEDRGVYKTTDGGLTWKRTLFSDAQSGAIDLVMEPNNPSVFYASTWTVIRTPHSLESGGKGSLLWKSVDGGNTWQIISNKMNFSSKAILGIIGIAIAPSNPERLFAIVESTENGGLFKSDDAGETWENVSTNSDIRQRAWYFSKVFVDPKNADIVYALNVGFFKSTDAGKTFKQIRTPHGDHHDMWIDNEDGNRMIIGDDGGAQVSFDGGANWSTMNNQPTAQFYRVSTDNHYPYRILGAQQDNSTVRIASQTAGNSITQNDWSSTAGFESGYVVANPLNSDIVYGGNYSGYISRYNHSTNENKAISVWPDDPLGSGANTMKYRFQWNFPIFFSPHDPKKLYAAANHLFSTTNDGASWQTISPDLTTNDKTKQMPSGGPITKDNTGVEVYCTIFTATESYLEKDLLWTGSDDGVIQMSKDAGLNWQNVTPPNTPKWIMWNCVEVDPFKKGTCYFVGTRYKLDDFTPYIFKTENYGKTWEQITTGINFLHFTRCLRADKKLPGLLYAGTEYGLYISYDYGKNWKSFQLNLPIVPITDMTIKNNDLIIATQGRAFWVMDDLSMIQNANKINIQKEITIFNTTPVYRYEGKQDLNIKNAGVNAKTGLVLNYILPNYKDADTTKIMITDAKGKLVKQFSNMTIAKYEKIKITNGTNQFNWNLKYADGDKIDGMVLWQGTPDGHIAFPGKYFAKINWGLKADSIEFEVLANPLFNISKTDYEQQESFITKVKDQHNELIKTIKNTRNTRTQLADLKTRLGDKIPDDVKKMIDSISKQLNSVEDSLYQTKAKSVQDLLNYPIRLNDKIAGVYNYAYSADAAPNLQAINVFDDLSNQIKQVVLKYNNIAKVQLPLLNEEIWKRKLMVIGVSED